MMTWGKCYACHAERMTYLLRQAMLVEYTLDGQALASEAHVCYECAGGYERDENKSDKMLKY